MIFTYKDNEHASSNVKIYLPTPHKPTYKPNPSAATVKPLTEEEIVTILLPRIQQLQPGFEANTLTNDEVTEYYILRHAAVHYELMPPLTEDQKVHETDEGQLIIAEDFEFNFGQKSLETLKFEGGISFGNY